MAWSTSTPTVIYSVERVEPYRTLLEPLWEAAQDGAVTIVSSPILIIEAPVKPLRDGNMEIEMQYRELFQANAVRFLDASYPVFEDAARLRATARLTTPDAIHAATALRADCSLFVTNDTDFRRVQDLLSPSWAICSKSRRWDKAPERLALAHLGSPADQTWPA